MERINQVKSQNSLVWTQDLIHELRKENISDLQIKRILSMVPKKVSVPIGKTFVHLVDYNDFIIAIETVTKKRAHDEVRNVENFRKALKEGRKNKLNQNVVLSSNDDLPLHSFKREENKKIVIPTVEEILKEDISFPEPKWPQVENEVEYYYDYISSMIEGILEKQKYRNQVREEEGILVNSNIPSNLESIKDTKQPKTKMVERKKFVPEPTIDLNPKKNSLGATLWSKLKKGAIKFVDFLVPDLEDSLEEKTYSSLPSEIEEPEKEYAFKNVKQREKDVRYKLYLLCKKLTNKKLLEMSNEDISMLAFENKKYLKKLNKMIKEDTCEYDYETEMALLVSTKIDEALSLSKEQETLGFQNRIQNIYGIQKYLKSYIINLKEYFVLPEKKPNIISFPLDKTVKKNLLKVCASTIVASLTLSSFLSSQNKNEEKNIKIEQEEMVGSVNKKAVKGNTVVQEQASEKIWKEVTTAISENQVTMYTLTKEEQNKREERKRYLSIGEEVSVIEGARVFTFAPDLTDSSKSQKPYYEANMDIGRRVRSVVLKYENTILTVHTNEDVEYYLSMNYDVLGYQIDNMYSYQNDIYKCSEGFYEENKLERKLACDATYDYTVVDSSEFNRPEDTMYSYQNDFYHYGAYYEEDHIERKLVL